MRTLEPPNKYRVSPSLASTSLPPSPIRHQTRSSGGSPPTYSFLPSFLRSFLPSFLSSFFLSSFLSSIPSLPFLSSFLPSFLSSLAKAIFHPRSKTLRHLLESSSIREYSVAERRQKAVVGELARYTQGTVSGRGRGPRPTGWSYRFSCVPTRFKPTLRTLFRSTTGVVCCLSRPTALGQSPRPNRRNRPHRGPSYRFHAPVRSIVDEEGHLDRSSMIYTRCRFTLSSHTRPSFAKGDFNTRGTDV